MRVLITGASSGLGAHFARVFHDHGHKLVLSGRKILPNLTGAQCITGDIRDRGVISKFRSVRKSIDIFVNNAAYYPPKGVIDNLSSEDISDTIVTNLIAPIQILQAIGPVKLLININSLAGKNPDPGEAVYCASKFGLRGFSESIRASGVKTLDVYLGAMRTPMTAWRPDHLHLMDPEEVAAAVYAAAFPAEESLRVSELTLVKTKC